ncbi:MAG: anthranilate synthase component II [Desulfococcaceae bacterium]
MTKLLVIDNTDSFTFNLVQMFRRFPLDITVVRSDRITPEAAEALEPDYLLISPGPRDPAHAGVSLPLLRTLGRRIPTLGVCLGMQCVNEVYGGRTERAPAPVHGKVSEVRHDGSGILAGVPSPFRAARYHSLAVRMATGGPLLATAHSPDGVVMALRHPRLPLFGVQFHPESFLTENGLTIVENFLKLAPEKETIHDRSDTEHGRGGNGRSRRAA